MASQIIPPADRLKARFKERCAQTNNQYQNWQIRVHRALSWYRRAWELSAEDVDVQFMLLWVAFNSLYARWDSERNAPFYDSASRNSFLESLHRDSGGAFDKLLQGQRGLVLKHLENPYLSPTFWRDPESSKAKHYATEDARYIDANFKQGQHLRVLKQLFDRLYVLRGQLMHGAATGGSKLNRKTLSHGVLMLMSLMPVIFETVIEHGSHDDWPDLCYPPMK